MKDKSPCRRLLDAIPVPTSAEIDKKMSIYGAKNVENMQISLNQTATKMYLSLNITVLSRWFT